MRIHPGETRREGAAGLKPRSPVVAVVVHHLAAEAAYRIITRVLSARGTDHLLLKGPHLAATVYDKDWERDYRDLDVLVRPGQFQDALAALMDDGFSLMTGPAGREATVTSYYNRGLISPHGWLVELHRAFCAYDLYPVDFAFWG